MAPSKQVIVIGAGAFGMSTALFLQRHRRDDIRVLLLDSQTFPSIDSASAHDTSRAVRPDYADPFYANLAEEAVAAWKTDPVFSGHYRESGRICSAPPGSPFAKKCRRVLEAIHVEVDDFGSGTDKVDGLHRQFPLLGDREKLSGWDFYLNPAAGWANPHESLISAMEAYKALGGRFIGHPTRGLVVDNVLEQTDSQPGRRVVGVRTADGKSHAADEVIYATGALTTANEGLVPELGSQIQPIGFAIAHWKLDSPGELGAWSRYPVVDMYHHGYFFPPEPSTGLMKLGLGIVGFTNDQGARGRDFGVALANSSLSGTALQGRIPAMAEDGIRSVLATWAPSLAGKKFLDTKLCWDAMTPDGGWLIDHHPDIVGLHVATGGSGHGFKFLPVIGRYICQVLDIANVGSGTAWSPETIDHDEMRRRWRWGREANINVNDRTAVLQGRPVVDALTYLEYGAPETLQEVIRPKL